MVKENWWKRYHQNRILIFGILLTVLGVYELQDSFVIKSRLKELKGTLRTADTYLSSNTDRYGHSSQKSELIFYLNEFKKKFYLAHNIGESYDDRDYDNILSQLNSADSISVWVKPGNIEDYQPKIFQISSNKKIILALNDVSGETGFLTMFLLLVGIGSILFYLYIRFPERWNKIMD
jgi:hypothetical protein